MENNIKKSNRGSIGFGSSYRKGKQCDLKESSEIGAALGGEIWMIKPDRDAKAANPCLWMQAGVVGFKTCNNFYDCTSCKYDRGMKEQAEKGKHPSWQDAMRKRSSLERVCRHTLTNRIERRVCAYNYDCSNCDFDQFFEEVWAAKTGFQPSEIHTLKGFRLPVGSYLHHGHTWARIESGGTIRVGMDDFSVKLLGEADALDLPPMGKELFQGKIGWGLKREQNLADVLSPLNGVILEVNAQVREKPMFVNHEPYGGGWLFAVRNPDTKGALKNLMDNTISMDWMAGEIEKLEGMIETVSGPLAADGGTIMGDIYGNLPSLGWKNLTRTFLRTE
ncbi:MAG: glycine cleavage system protein H [Deltaproteobacteria bacterium]|nr:glycine cleavage system protein H [Deltaproteobacteria bacterium]